MSAIPSTAENFYISSVKEKEQKAKATSEKGTVTNKEFLRLLTAQLTNQDPLQPMEDTQFITQLAQLQGLQEQIDIGKSLTAMRLEAQIRAAADLIGCYVSGKNAGGQEVAGLVSSVSVRNGQAEARLHTGASLPYANIKEVKMVMSK
ncbi:MAG: hypothetical protein N3A66_10790 [Planctomycetota bacterium]|nr:hypothetical protein [Planctomycetota bacterium]